MKETIAEMQTNQEIVNYISGKNKNEQEVLLKQINAVSAVNQKHPDLYLDYSELAWDNLRYAEGLIRENLQAEKFCSELSTFGGTVTRTKALNATAMDYFADAVAPLRTTYSIIMLGGDGVYTGCWALECDDGWYIWSYHEGDIVKIQCPTPLVFSKEKARHIELYKKEMGAA